MWFDTHCHLDAPEFDADRVAVVAAARANGVRHLLIPAVERQTFPAVRACCSRFPDCAPAYGIHPLYVNQAREEDLAALRDWLREEFLGDCPPRAIGEIGLDFFVPGHDAARQTYFFAGQLDIADEFGLPAILHTRRSIDTVLKHLRRSGVRRGIAHAFNGSRQQAEQFITLGFKLGFGGAMTYPGSTRIRELAASLPLESIVLETDAPDIPPVWLRKAKDREHKEDGAPESKPVKPRNSPDQLPRIASTLAELRKMPVADIAAATSANANAIFGFAASP